MTDIVEVVVDTAAAAAAAEAVVGRTVEMHRVRLDTAVMTCHLQKVAVEALALHSRMLAAGLEA